MSEWVVDNCMFKTWIGVIGKDDVRLTHQRNLITITMACTATFVSMQCSVNNVL